MDGDECGLVLLASHGIDDLLFGFHSMIGDEHRDRAANRRSARQRPIIAAAAAFFWRRADGEGYYM
jgi:hypothetical protein